LTTPRSSRLYITCPRAVDIPMARDAIRPTKIAASVFISVSLFLWFRFAFPFLSMAKANSREAPAATRQLCFPLQNLLGPKSPNDEIGVRKLPRENGGIVRAGITGRAPYSRHERKALGTLSSNEKLSLPAERVSKSDLFAVANQCRSLSCKCCYKRVPDV